MKKGSYKELLVIIMGLAIVAAAVYFFMLPSHVSVGSASALAMILSNFIPLPVSVITLIMNIGLLIIGFLFIGPEFGGKTFGFSLKTVTAPAIPYLAKGAVLPANKPFMAVVGDQRHGTNVEAPLTTIQEAVAVVLPLLL